ncbi:MAG: PRC-barrel domain-containing protein [Sphingobacteriales bacterium]|nr:PRC-barrel domain-containing protein [Sphingobacteriales bacterium]
MKNSLLEQNLTGINDEGENPNYPLQILGATSIIGDRVENASGEHLGKIKEVMLDINKGIIEYYVIEFSGSFWETDKYFAIPADMITVEQDKRVFILDKTRKELEDSPGFDKTHWPETNLHYYSSNETYW